MYEMPLNDFSNLLYTFVVKDSKVYTPEIVNLISDYSNTFAAIYIFILIGYIKTARVYYCL